MATIEATTIFANYKSRGVKVNAAAMTGGSIASAQFDDDGYVEINTLHATDIGNALVAEGATRVDVLGLEDTVTPGTVQAYTTIYSIRFVGSSNAYVNLREGSAAGAKLFGPLQIPAAPAIRTIVFGLGKVFAGGLFVEVESGSLGTSTFLHLGV